jgi:formylglycine-generating enzyme required for sulfatase activity
LLVHSSSNVYIGKLPYGNFLINGSIADVRIYNRALSEEEITLLYNSYNPKIVMKTSLPKIKLYGGDKEIKKNGFIRVDKNINNAIYFDNPESNLYGKQYFYVMQYQARNNGGVPTSTGSDLPWVNINQINAKAVSEAAGYHLITNWEWMAIARDIEQVAENWTGGQVGSGMIKRGNVGITDDGSYNGADPETGILNDKAKLKLSNGEEIYHFSGNVWEWVDDTITQGEQYINFNQNASNWYEFNATDLFKVAQKLPYTEVGPKETYATPSSNGLGKILINTSNGSSANRAFLRGGKWDNGANAGVFALSLNGSPTVANTTIGFRCARYGNE